MKISTSDYFLLIILLIIPQNIGAQSDTISPFDKLERVEAILNRFRLNAYGVINYYAFNWETLPDRRNAIDPERLNIYLYHDFSDKIQFKSEIEFEHAGTGTTMAFDPLEEFGEFEQEIAKGGQVVVEQLNLLFKLHKSFNLRIGKMRFYVGNASKQDQPREYFTAYRPEIENTILPLGWYETGIEFNGDIPLKPSQAFPFLSYKAYIVSGLDNTGFSAQNWIRRGYQTRFETINADNLAYAVRLDYNFAKDSELGFNFYAGNATGNRPKNDFTSPSWVTFGDIHFSAEIYPWRIRAYGMLGHIQNSEALSNANRNLSNNLDVKRTPVGNMAGGSSAEIAYDVLQLTPKTENQQFYLFGKAEWYDSMLQTEGTVSDNPRYERQVFTIGINYFPVFTIVFKTHYAWRNLGSGEQENTFALGFGFDF
ncbi:MAG: autotransporter outer membrane beta-barrel domain-containing protein [Saprospiraceae bacterium]|nr:autotransporter outer membrane beta-barrel domain-containing protein [Saprospiraceae bacterium]